ncbi:MAG: peptide-binding protein [Candidatus Omnitrophota bacterium]
MNCERKNIRFCLKAGAYFFFFLCLSLSQVLFAQAEQNNIPTKGDAFISGVTAGAKTLVPILACDSASANICSLIFNGLIKYDKDLKLVPDLAQSWEIQEDGLKIVFHLRKGVLWHDGKEFTADDVEFTYQKLIDPQVQTPYSSDFLKVKKFHVCDPYTIEIVYEEPFSPALSTWGMWIMPKHILENENLNTTDFSSCPIGTGPYKFKNWKRQEKIELTAFEQYFDGCPFISRYITKIIPDQTTIFLELQTKTIDSCLLTPLQFLRQTQNTFFKNNYHKFRLNSFSYTYLGYNLEDARFKDKKVRQAFNFAVNKKELIQVVLLGQGKEVTGPFIPESWAYNDAISNADFNPEYALELLRQAGWQDTNHDSLLDKNGKNFEFTIITSQGNESRIKTAELIQKYLKNIGIKVNIKVLEWSALLDEYISKRRFEAILLGWSLSMDPDCYDIWHSSKTKEGEFNFIHYNNSEVDHLLEKARITFDLELRKKYYQRIHALIYDDQPYMFLYAPDSLEVVSSRFKGIDPAPIGIGHNFIKWWVPESQQRYKSE